MIHYEDFERERLDPIYDTVAPYSEMSKNERYFLNGIIRAIKPKKILEAGVSSGGGSAIILNAIRDIDGAELYSVDYREEAAGDIRKPSGFLVEQKFPALMDKWHIFRGGDVSAFIEEIGGDIDLFVLDTAHIHPWETLNFICVLPFMKKDSSLTILHDITLFVSPVSRVSMACRYLFASVVSDGKFSPTTEGENRIFSNIGAFKVSSDTVKYADNLFQTLLIPWDVPVPEKDMKGIKAVISKHYSQEHYEFLCNAAKFQDYMFSHPEKIRSTVKNTIRRNYPKLYSFLASTKHFFMKLFHVKNLRKA